jgi:hypothetical protein
MSFYRSLQNIKNKNLAFPIRDYSEHSWTFPANTRLCTKNPVRNLTRRSMRTFWSHFNSFLRPDRPIFPIKTLSMNDFWCKAGQDA